MQTYRFTNTSELLAEIEQFIDDQIEEAVEQKEQEMQEMLDEKEEEISDLLDNIADLGETIEEMTNDD